MPNPNTSAITLCLTAVILLGHQTFSIADGTAILISDNDAELNASLEAVRQDQEILLQRPDAAAIESSNTRDLILMPNDATKKPNNAILNPNNAALKPNSATSNPNNAMSNPNDATLHPNNARQRPNKYY